MKLGIAVKNLAASQEAYYLIRQANETLALNPGLDLIAFVEDQARPCVPLFFASMAIQELWGYDGPVVSTSLSTAEKALRCPGPEAVFYYQWDLEWMRLPAHRYRSLADLYRDPRLIPIVRSEDHGRAFEHAWSRSPVGVVEDWNLQQLFGVIAPCLAR